MKSQRFADRAEAGRHLGAVLAESYAGRDDVVVLGIDGRGLEVARAVAVVLGCRLHALARDGLAPEGLADQVILVVDDGVEGGGTATRVAALLRASNPTRLVLAVPVCPREPYAALARFYDEVIALQRPFMARSLAWHYRETGQPATLLHPAGPAGPP